MKTPILNFFLCSYDGITDALLLKLSAYYHKVITQCQLRLLMCIPNEYNMIRHPPMFDEFIICRLSPVESSFWETKEMQKYLFFISNSLNTSGTNILISNRIITPAFNWHKDVPLVDIVFSDIGNNHEEMVHANILVSKILDTDLIRESDLRYYDASIFAVSDAIRPDYLSALKLICSHAGMYLSAEKTNAILSVLAIIFSKRQNVSTDVLGLQPIDLDSDSIQNFYMI